MAATGRRRTWGGLVLAICAGAGLLFAAAHTTSDGEDLRPAGGDIASLLDERSHRADLRRAEAAELTEEVEDLTASVSANSAIDDLLQQIAAVRDVAGTTPMRGPGIRVTLTDAPRGADPAGIDPNYLVVHQQDIQAFVTALWAGGAEGVSLQGQRLVSTSAVVCVGSNVVIDGRAYGPPYVIEAVGDVSGMNFSLSTSPEVTNYNRYVERYGLGQDIETSDDIVLEPYDGTIGLRYASALRESIR